MPRERTFAEVGAVIRQRREAVGLTQEEVVARANQRAGRQVLSVPSLRIFERGKQDRYRQLTLYGIELGLDLERGTIEQLLDGEDLEAASRPPEDVITALKEELAAARADRAALQETLQEVRQLITVLRAATEEASRPAS